MAKATGTYAPRPLLSILRTGLKERLRERVQKELEPLRIAADSVTIERRELARMLTSLRDRIATIESIETGDFHGEMTVHAAWRRHPGVAEVFAGYGLPDCPSCSVGVDETLSEAADGYEIPLPTLLSELQALLRG